jgi:hypothetical protein
MTETHWCESLKEGDSVFVLSSHFSSSTISPAKVKKVTATLIRIEGTDSTYNKHGNEKGAFRWDHSAHLMPYTPENIERYEMQVLRNKLRRVLHEYDKRFDLMKLNKERIVEITKLLTEIKEELAPTKEKENV